jgi:hypothetical protein
LQASQNGELEEYEYARMRETDEIAEKLLVEEKAKMKEKIEIAKNLISLGCDNDFISKATGLTHAQIEQLRAEG